MVLVEANMFIKLLSSFSCESWVHAITLCGGEHMHIKAFSENTGKVLDKAVPERKDYTFIIV
jgi:hypothetical protein